MKPMMVLVVLLISISLTGCKEAEETKISHSLNGVTLTCLAHLNESESCDDYSSQEPEVIAVFEQVIKNAEPMPGILNYIAEYKVELDLIYHLSLGTDRTSKGLLVDLRDTHQGFEISVEDANKLRDIILQKQAKESRH